MLLGGYTEEACAWRDWLLRAAAGDPADLQIMYGVAGERRLTEFELDWLPGYEASRPVRVGNGAVSQVQLDVYGEVMDTLYQARKAGIPSDAWSWGLQRQLLQCLERAWTKPDEGLWEVRGPRRHFTHSKVLAWVAFDRGVKTIEQYGADGPLDRWRSVRAAIHEDVCRHGFSRSKGAFTQSYGSEALDASLLLVPLVGFLPASDPRVIGTVAAIERELLRDGFVLRYATGESTVTAPAGHVAAAAGRERVDHVDGLPPGEGAFLACTFWLVDNYILMGRQRGGGAVVRAAAGACERCRPARRGVRSRRAAAAGQLSPGVQPSEPGQHRIQPHPTVRPDRPSSAGNDPGGSVVPEAVDDESDNRAARRPRAPRGSTMCPIHRCRPGRCSCGRWPWACAGRTSRSCRESTGPRHQARIV